MKQTKFLGSMRGFTLLELSAALFIMGVVAMGTQQAVSAALNKSVVNRAIDGVLKVTEAVYAHYAASDVNNRTWPREGRLFIRTDEDLLQTVYDEDWAPFLPLGFASPENYYFDRVLEDPADPDSEVVGGIVSVQMASNNLARLVSAAFDTEYCPDHDDCDGHRKVILDTRSHFPGSNSFGGTGHRDAIEQAAVSDEFAGHLLDDNEVFVPNLLAMIEDDADFRKIVTNIVGSRPSSNSGSRPSARPGTGAVTPPPSSNQNTQPQPVQCIPVFSCTRRNSFRCSNSGLSCNRNSLNGRYQWRSYLAGTFCKKPRYCEYLYDTGGK